MATEQLNKLDPSRTIHLRGFDRRGAAAAMHSATSTGFTVSGVFRDLADFAVLVVWDADNPFEHSSFRYLPDFDFSGMALSFDLALANVQPIDSKKYPWIDWAFLDYIKADGTPGQVDLRQNMTTSGGAAASRTWTVTGTCQPYDRLTLWFENYAFDYIVPGKLQIVFTFWWNPQGTVLSITLGANTYTYTVTTAGGETGAQCAAGLAAAAASDPNASCSPVSNTIEVTPKTDDGDTISCSATGNGADTLWRALHPTYVVATSLRSQINGVSWPTGAPLTLSASGSGANVTVTANAGTDGNFAFLYELHKTSTMALSPAGANPLTGGAAPTSYHVTLDFSALGLTQVRQLWMTFAPKLPNALAYSGQEWSAVFSNWTVSDPGGKRALKIAGPGSVRVDSRDSWVNYAGAWSEETGWYRHGFARHTATVGDQVVVEYHCGHVHDLYLGTALYGDRGQFSVSVDGDSPTTLDCYLAVEPAIAARRRLRSGLPAGEHWVQLTLTGKNAASSGYHVYFDFLEAAVLSDVQDPVKTYSNVTAATDWDTNAAYNLPPARLAWDFDRAGFRARWNHYLGVFWWNERHRVGGSFPAKTITFGGTWAGGDTAFVTIGSTTLGKSVFPADTIDTIAAHFCYFINATLVGVWAEVAGAVLTIHCHTPIWEFTCSTSKSSSAGTITEGGSLEGGVEGTWEIDAAATPVLNRAARDWHIDLFAELNARSWSAVVALSMELVNPPDNPPTDVWAARFLDDVKVETDTVFANFKSTHCAFSDKVLAYQKSAYLEMAALMSAAGLVPWLQFGETIWWFFTNYNAGSNPDGGMAFYDAYTKAQAVSALGRDLHHFVGSTDDPSVNSYADANFLRGRIKSHIDAIRSHVLTSYSTAKFELLWPFDVNYPSLTPSGRGGALNRYVNLPLEFEQKTGSGLDSIKMEALAFGSVERNLDRARETMRFPTTAPRDWLKADVAYLLPIFDAGCPWVRELKAARAEGLGTIVIWANDHIALLDRELPLPELDERRTRFF